MHIFVKLAAGAAAIGALAAPAAAQYYPQPTYPQQYQQAYPGYAYPQQAYPQAYPQQGYAYPGQQGYAQNPIQMIVDQLLGNRYQTSDRTKVAQCAAVAQQHAAARYGANAYGQRAYGYNNRYANNAYAAARVTGITNVQRRNNGGLRVSGMMSSGRNYGAYASRYNQGYNRAYAAAVNDLSFSCNVDYRGAVTNVRVRPTSAWRR